MRAGRLRHRVTLQSRSSSRDATSGAEIVAFVDFQADVPAEVVPLSGREFLAASAEQAQVVARATIRYLAGVVPSMRLVHESVNYNIRAVLPDPSFREYMTLMLEAGPNDGR